MLNFVLVQRTMPIMEQSIICVEPQSINKKCIRIPYGTLKDKVCIIPLVNIVETD